MVVDSDAGSQLITSAAGSIEALDALTGERQWLFTDIEGNHVPSVAVDDRLVVAASSKVAQSLALPRNLQESTGETRVVDEGRVAWRAEGVASGFGSPLIHDRCVFFVNKAGVANCVDRESGETAWQHRLAEACWASPVAAGDLVYFFTKEGHTTVLRPGAEGPEVIAENTLGLNGTVYGGRCSRKLFPHPHRNRDRTCRFRVEARRRGTDAQV